MNQVLPIQTFSYRQSLLANKERVARLVVEGDSKQARFHRLKRKLYLAQKGRCIFCRRKTFLDSDHSPKSLLATREHVKPKCHGGGNGQHNLKISCSHCNNRRGSQNFDKFMVKMGNVIGSKTGIIAKTGNKAKRRANRNFNLLAESLWVLDGGEHKASKRTHTDSDKKAEYRKLAFISAMNAMDETRARMGLTLSNISII